MFICHKCNKKMDNEVKINVKILTEGQEKLAQATVSSKELGTAIDQVSSNSRKLNDQLLNTNQRVQAFQTLRDGMQQIVDVTKQMTDMYAQAEVANTKLTTVMKQRMSAQDSDIQSIRQVIASQKELGIISGTVQTAGAQQMATFLNERSSLETLIPAMNNLVAQQDGLNATQEDATSIGNMMGKAMQGQAEVLQRVGITFTDAQKQVLKYGTEEQRAATLAQVIKDNVGDMNTELAKTDAGQAKKAAMWFDGLKVSIGSALSEVQPLISAFNQIGMASFALLQVKNGYVAIAGSISIATIATKAHTLATSISTGITNIHKAAMIQLTAATGSATVAATALTAAYTMGLSVAITGIVMLISNLCSGEKKTTQNTKEMSEAAQDAKQKQDSLNQTMTDAKSGLAIMIAKLKDFKGSKEQEKTLVQECNTKYGEAMGYYSSVSDWYKVLVSNSETYCAQMVNEVRARQLANQAAREEDALDKAKTLNTSFKKSRAKLNPGDPGYNGQTDIQTAADKRLEAQEKQHAATMQKMNAVVKEGVKLQEKLHTAPNGTKQYSTAQNADAAVAAKKVGKDDKKDDDKLKTDAKSYEDLGHNIEVYQKKIDNAAPSEEKKIKIWTEQIEKAKQAQQRIKDLQAEYAKPAQLKTLEDYDNEIRRQEGLLKTAGDSERKTINTNIEDLKRKRGAMEQSAKTAPVMEEIKSYEDLDNALSYYNDTLKTATATERTSIQAQIIQLKSLREKWEEADAAADKPAATDKLKTIKQIDNALSYYQQQLQTANSSEITETQATINELEKKKKILTDLAGIATSKTELGDLKGLGNMELKIKLKAIGIDEIQSKLQNLKRLANSSATDPKQKKEIQGQIQEWTKYGNILKKNDVTLKGAYSSVRGVTGGINTLTKTLKSNGTAWEKVTGVIDAGIEIYEAVRSVIAIVKALTAATTTEQVAEAATQATANSMEATTFMGLAASKTAAAYAGMPFVGAGLAAAQMVAFKAMETAALIPAFADGGVAYGKTLGIFGEYANASTNPEVVAPLDKLKNIIGSGNGGGTENITFRIKGRSLVGIAEREKRRRDRS